VLDDSICAMNSRIVQKHQASDRTAVSSMLDLNFTAFSERFSTTERYTIETIILNPYDILQKEVQETAGSFTSEDVGP
jgi:hypothetical protein